MGETAKLEFLRDTLDVLILKALVWGPLHGYAITNLIRRQSDDALIVEEGTLYPALWRLESKDLLESEWGLSENNRKAKFYKLTPAGRRYLREEVETWEAYAEAVAKCWEQRNRRCGGNWDEADSYVAPLRPSVGQRYILRRKR